MSKITAKLQVTVPKHIADAYGLKPGDEVWWEPAGEVIRLLTRPRRPLSVKERLALFDASVERQRRYAKTRKWPRVKDRGWRREDLYGTRGLSR